MFAVFDRSPWGAVCAALLYAALAGCGELGAPQPPSLDLPQPVRDLTATRAGNIVHLAWTTSGRTTDHTAVSGGVRTVIYRAEGPGTCEVISELPLKLGQSSSFDDALPTDALQGPPRLLTYYVELLNHAKKSAGRSNSAYSATGPAAPEVAQLTASVRPEGVELHWDALHWPASEGARDTVRITRRQEEPPPRRAAKSPLANSAEAPLVTLEVASAGVGATGALDPTARFGESYSYRAQTVQTLTLDGHTVELAGAPSQTVAVFTRDRFPPAVPRDLAAAADPSAKAIDLTWSPGSEADPAGYFVYRQLLGPGAAREALLRRVSGDTPLPTPEFHDADVAPGARYAYSVSAVDAAGNESARSPEVEEEAEETQRQ